MMLMGASLLPTNNFGSFSPEDLLHLATKCADDFPPSQHSLEIELQSFAGFARGHPNASPPRPSLCGT